MFYFFPEYEIGQSITTWEWSTTIILKILNITSVPYHLSQAATTVKCTDSDRSYGIGYNNGIQ